MRARSAARHGGEECCGALLLGGGTTVTHAGVEYQLAPWSYALQAAFERYLEDQAVDWVVANARVTDRPASFAELTGFGRQG